MPDASSSELADIAASAWRGKAAATMSPIPLAAVRRIDALFEIERGINGLAAKAKTSLRDSGSGGGAPWRIACYQSSRFRPHPRDVERS
jgi:hypothetical protein